MAMVKMESPHPRIFQALFSEAQLQMRAHKGASKIELILYPHQWRIARGLAYAPEIQSMTSFIHLLQHHAHLAQAITLINIESHSTTGRHNRCHQAQA